MKILIVCSLAMTSFFFSACRTANVRSAQKESLPAMLRGHFIDDYGIEYEISDSLWWQLPNAKYHIIQWNKEDQYLIARNDSTNSSGKGLYTRIDYSFFEGMKPWAWGFCLTAYEAVSADAARATQPADRLHPKKGCNGFPFSRMQRH